MIIVPRSLLPLSSSSERHPLAPEAIFLIPTPSSLVDALRRFPTLLLLSPAGVGRGQRGEEDQRIFSRSVRGSGGGGRRRRRSGELLLVVEIQLVLAVGGSGP